MARVRECIRETDKIQSQQNVLHHRAIIFYTYLILPTRAAEKYSKH